MSRAATALSAFILLSCINVYNAQQPPAAIIPGTCITYQHNFTGSPSICDTFIPDGTSIFVANDTSVAALYSDVAPIEQIISFVSEACRASGPQFVCEAAFRPCLDNGQPRIPCKDLCEDTVRECGAILALANRVLDCNDQETAIENCINITGTSNTSINSFTKTCAEMGLLDDADTTADIKCGLCPFPVFSDNVYTSIYAYMVTLCILSLILQVPSFAAFVSTKTYLTFTAHFFIIYSIDTIVPACLGVLIGLSVEDWVCSNPTTFATQSYVPCAVAGTLLVFVSNQFHLATMCHTFTVYYNFKLGPKLLNRGGLPNWYKYTTYAIIWGLPTILSLIAGTTNSIGGGPYACFLLGNWQDWVLLFGFPMVPSILISLFCLAYIIYNLFTGVSGSAQKRVTTAMLTTLFTLVILFIVVLSSKIYVDSTLGDIEAIVVRYINCVGTISNTIDDCTSIQDESNVYLGVIFITVLVSYAAGVIIFFSWLPHTKFRAALSNLPYIFSRKNSTSARSTKGSTGVSHGSINE